MTEQALLQRLGAKVIHGMGEFPHRPNGGREDILAKPVGMRECEPLNAVGHRICDGNVEARGKDLQCQLFAPWYRMTDLFPTPSGVRWCNSMESLTRLARNSQGLRVRVPPPSRDMP